ncbi:hypothetical protein HJFPF1_01443 [Paramyrothecium foliicola]|nr:hypothetical protein HJFPF1_01443 [Paramyrothecium foliicola]
MTDEKADSDPSLVLTLQKRPDSATNSLVTMSATRETSTSTSTSTNNNNGATSFRQGMPHLQPAAYGLPAKHTTWTATTFAMAKCDCCEKQRRPMIQSCNKCSFSICSECYDKGKLAQNALHDIDDDSVAWAVAESQKGKAYKTTRTSSDRGSRRGRIRAVRGAAKASGRGRARGRASTRARGRASRSRNSPSETLSPYTLLDSPLTDFTMPSDMSVDPGSPASIPEENGVMFLESSPCDGPNTPPVTCITDDEVSNEQVGAAANILTGLSRPSPVNIGSPSQQQPALRRNRVEMESDDQYSSLLQTPGLPEPTYPKVGGFKDDFYASPQSRRTFTYGGFIPSDQLPQSLFSPQGNSENSMGNPPISNIHDQSPPTYSRVATLETIVKTQPPSECQSRGAVKRKRPSSSPISYPVSRRRLPPYPEATINTNSDENTGRSRPSVTLPPITSLFPNGSHVSDRHGIVIGAESVGNASQAYKDEAEPKGHQPPHQLRRLHYMDLEQYRRGIPSAGAPQNEPPIRLNATLLSRMLQTGARTMRNAQPGRSLDRCLRDQAAHAWDGGNVHRFLAYGPHQNDRDAHDDAAAFRLALHSTFHACKCLGLNESTATRQWLCELQMRLEEREGEGVAAGPLAV